MVTNYTAACFSGLDYRGWREDGADLRIGRSAWSRRLASTEEGLVPPGGRGRRVGTVRREGLRRDLDQRHRRAGGCRPANVLPLLPHEGSGPVSAVRRTRAIRTRRVPPPPGQRAGDRKPLREPREAGRFARRRRITNPAAFGDHQAPGAAADRNGVLPRKVVRG